MDQLSEQDSIYVERARRAVKRLALREVAPDDAAGALESLADLTIIDVEPPLASPRAEVRLVKGSIKRLVRWYVRYVAEQVTALGQGLERLGAALVERTDDLAIETQQISGRLSELETRISALESKEQR